MTVNAQWMIECEVTLPNGGEERQAIWLASPDLTDTKEAARRARETGEKRLLRKLQKSWGQYGHLVKVRAVRVQCVG